MTNRLVAPRTYPMALANAIRNATQIHPRGTVEDLGNSTHALYDERLFDFYLEAAERVSTTLHRQGFDNDNAIVALTQLQERIQGEILQYQAIGYEDDSVMIQTLRNLLP